MPKSYRLHIQTYSEWKVSRRWAIAMNHAIKGMYIKHSTQKVSQKFSSEKNSHIFKAMNAKVHWKK